MDRETSVSAWMAPKCLEIPESTRNAIGESSRSARFPGGRVTRRSRTAEQGGAGGRPPRRAGDSELLGRALPEILGCALVEAGVERVFHRLLVDQVDQHRRGAVAHLERP